ncbi:MAG: ankyrin repeat domain-containing protein [Sterolibacterium sp.]|nr:ankyrin repeat domain-containing protein [Sterolibacterium sp.]
MFWLSRFTLIVIALSLLACAKPRRPAPPPQVMPAQTFACDMTAQAVMCSSERLAKLDGELVAAFHAALRRSDSLGREHLNAMQKRWLADRARACGVPTLQSLPDDRAAPPALAACLINLYADRVDVLRRWPVALPVPSVDGAAAKSHPLAAYVEFRLVESADAPRCGALAQAFNGALRTIGALDIGRIPGLGEIAGTHGLPRAQGYSVDLQDAGPYAGFALRGSTLRDGSGLLLDAASLGNWVRRLPNHGGRASSIATQTGDYESIDVFRSTQWPNQTLALLVEPWGKYAPGAQGEWAYAGVYRLLPGAPAEPLCLYRTYMTPPLKNELASLSGYVALQKTLAEIAATAPSATGELVGRELHEDYLLRQELQWQIQNMPLIALGEAQRNGWWGWLRKRHDSVHDALFAWSERSLRNKRVWRRLLTQLEPAAEELAALWQRTQRLSEADAQQAAQLTLMRLLAQYASDLPGLLVHLPNAPLAGNPGYAAKYPPLASEADILDERSYGGLYSAALNGADAEVIDDYLRFELADAQTRMTQGEDGETALMAAVESPAIVQQLIAAGFNVNASDARGRNALMNALLVGQVESVRLLLASGARDAGTACRLLATIAPAASRPQLAKMLCQ